MRFLVYVFCLAVYALPANAIDRSDILGFYECDLNDSFLPVSGLELRESGNALFTFGTGDEAFRQVGKFELDEDLLIVHSDSGSAIFEIVIPRIVWHHAGYGGSCSMVE